jgi:hypothetical protein
VLGDVRPEDETPVLSVNSLPRSDRGCALLSEILGRLVGQPSAKTESVEQIMASRGAGFITFSLPMNAKPPADDRSRSLRKLNDR